MDEASRSTHLQTIVRNWLNRYGLKQAWLSDQAGLNRSILSRFLSDKTQIDEVTALRIYKVIKWRMNPLERDEYLEAADLRSLVDDVADPANTWDTSGDVFITSMATGMALLQKAQQAESYAMTLQYCREAERAFGAGSTNAAFVACTAARNLSMMGNLDEASDDLIRVGTQYAGCMDVPTQVHYAASCGYVEFDRANLTTAQKWFQRAIDICNATGNLQQAYESVDYMWLIPMERLRAAESNATPDYHNLLAQADKALNQIYDYMQAYHQGRHEMIAGYFHFRSQYRYLTGDVRGATRDMNQSISIVASASPNSIHLLRLTQAEMALLQGETEQAHRLADMSMEACVALGYNSGISRILRIQSEAAFMEGDTTDALELALAAQCVNPLGTYHDRVKLSSVIAAANNAARTDHAPSHYRRLTHSLFDVATAQNGVFRVLSAVTPRHHLTLDEVFKSALTL